MKNLSWGPVVRGPPFISPVAGEVNTKDRNS